MKTAAQRKLTVRPIENLIYLIRGKKVMLDSDLADIYGVETRSLNQAVQRNLGRFPEDFMFQLLSEETENLRSQIVISRKSHGGRRYLPNVFTEHGVVMLASVINSERAIQMSLMVVRAFVRMREIIAENKDIAVRVEKLERGHESTGAVIEMLVEDIDKLSSDIHWIKNPPLKPKHPIGFVGSVRASK